MWADLPEIWLVGGVTQTEARGCRVTNALPNKRLHPKMAAVAMKWDKQHDR